MQQTASYAAQLGKTLQQHAMRLVCAESCTGGGLSYAITTVPGCSAWLERSYITYSNQAKIDCLAVDPAIIEQFGAVSEETALAMAHGALQHSQADISISITGIAGPGGATVDKPLGTVWLASCLNDKEYSRLLQLQGDRERIREQTIVITLQWLQALVHQQ